MELEMPNAVLQLNNTHRWWVSVNHSSNVSFQCILHPSGRLFNRSFLAPAAASQSFSVIGLPGCRVRKETKASGDSIYPTN